MKVAHVSKISSWLAKISASGNSDNCTPASNSRYDQISSAVRKDWCQEFPGDFHKNVIEDSLHLMTFE